MTATTVSAPTRTHEGQSPFLMPVVGVSLAVAILTAGFLLRPGTSEQMKIAPTIALDDVRVSEPQVGLPVGKPAVVNFLGSWCAPCRSELPLLEEAADAAPGVAFVGVDVRDQRDSAATLLDDVGVSFPVGFDSSGVVADRYEVFDYPTTVFIDASGRIVHREVGELDVETLNRWVSELGAT